MGKPGLGGKMGKPATFLIESFNGSRWQEMPSPPESGGTLEGVSCANAASCVAVVSFFEGRGIPHDVMGSFDGKNWSAVTIPGGPATEFLSGVSCTKTGFCAALAPNMSFATQGLAALIAEHPALSAVASQYRL